MREVERAAAEEQQAALGFEADVFESSPGVESDVLDLAALRVHAIQATVVRAEVRTGTTRRVRSNELASPRFQGIECGC